MKKLKFTLILIVSSMMSLTVSAQEILGAANMANAQLGTGAVGVATSNAFVSKNAGRCSGWRFHNCLKAALGVMQIVQLLMNMRQTMGVRDDFSMPGANWSNGGDTGFCFNTSTCSQDGIDVAATDLEQALKTGSSKDYNDAFDKIEKNAMAALKDMEAKGFKLDQKAGIMTGPNGLKGSINDAKAQMGSKLSALSKSKLADVKEAMRQAALARASSLKGKSGRRGLAGSGAGSTNVVFQDDLSGALGGGAYGKSNGAKNKNNKDGKGKSGFLAGLSDKAKGGVGVAGDNIFEMINRRYTKKTQQKEFITGQ